MTTKPHDLPFGYCTNVHAGATLDEAQANLERVAMRVQQLVAPEGRLPVGLWLSEQAAHQLIDADDVASFNDWLSERSLKAYTFNGFPQGDFHQAIVKHAVYEPTWLDARRVEYTCLLADILSGLLPAGQGGSISTLPLGWPTKPWQADDFARAAANLRFVAHHLHIVAEETGHEIVLAIEPEPGCVLDSALDIVNFFQLLLSAAKTEFVRRHITVCHDICHSAVMFEAQRDALQAYADNGIRVGKLQVSSAVEVPWQEAKDDDPRRQAMAEQLRSFNEPRYLHQTTRVGSAGDQGVQTVELVEDLPLALDNWLAELQPARLHEPWRVHFHVPIYTDRFGALKATRDDITAAVNYLHSQRSLQVGDRPWFTGHYEVETYAWGVLPAELQVPDLATGIAQELEYFRTVLASEIQN